MANEKLLIGVVGCLHGDEHYGKKVLNRLQKNRKYKQNAIALFANKKAYDKNKRFIDQDLNRSFPGNRNGNYEERLAMRILKKIKDCAFVIDLHSSSTETPPFIILSKVTKQHLEFIRHIPIENVVIMHKKMASGHSLIDYCKCGVSLEMGRHNDKNLPEKAYRSLIKIFGSLQKSNELKPPSNPKTFFVAKRIVKHGKRAMRYKNLRNFIEYKRDGESFFPILITPKKRAFDGVYFLRAEKREASYLDKLVEK